MSETSGTRLVEVRVAQVVGRQPGVVLWRRQGPPPPHARSGATPGDAHAADTSHDDAYVPVPEDEFEHRVVLEEVGGSRALSIFIGKAEAHAIGMILSGQPFARPMTYELLAHITERFDIRVRRVEVTRMERDVFYATIVAAAGDREETFDARPSDALNVAIRAHAPIYVTDDLLRPSEPNRAVPVDVVPARVELMDEETGERVAVLEVPEPPTSAQRIRLMRRVERARQVEVFPGRAPRVETGPGLATASAWQVLAVEQVESRLWRAVARREA